VIADFQQNFGILAKYNACYSANTKGVSYDTIPPKEHTITIKNQIDSVAVFSPPEDIAMATIIEEKLFCKR
jgi:hypothetical protein